jgi:spore coat polysaccharide biosynthesis predicted glycosyltransferase SpsG
MKILFNTEGNNYLGMGHIYECLRLGAKFKEKCNPEILYLLSSDSEPGTKKIQEAGYKVKIVERGDFDGHIKEIKRFNPNVVINDILYSKKEYMQKLSAIDLLIVSIEHIEKPESLNYADVTFNSLWPKKFNIRGKYYFGPSYVSLPDQFKDLPKREIRTNCKNFFICFGGSDHKGYTLKVIESLNTLDKDINVDVLVGPAFTYHNELRNLTIDERFNILNDITHVLPYMLNADIGLVSGGHTLNELVATGTPGMMFCHNEMEIQRAKLFADYYKICVNMNDVENLSPKELSSRIKDFANNFELRKSLSETGQKLQDGKGSDRIVKIILKNLEH